MSETQATEIKRLRAENKALRDTLSYILQQVKLIQGNILAALYPPEP